MTCHDVCLHFYFLKTDYLLWARKIFLMYEEKTQISVLEHALAEQL
jgi:hypothetical protein